LDEPSLFLKKGEVRDILIEQNEDTKKVEIIKPRKEKQISKENETNVPKLISGYNIPSEKQDLILSLINNANKSKQIQINTLSCKIKT
jgi:hypothetical protein